MATSNITAIELRKLLTYDPHTGLFHNIGNRNNNGALAGMVAGTTTAYGYISIIINKKHYFAHRLAWLYMTGEWPSDLIDHKNRIRSDNRFDNLRIASNSMNMQNAVEPRKNNSSGFLGVIPHGKAFRAQIMIGGKTKSLGTYSTPEKAHQAYLNAKAITHAGAVLGH